MARRNPQTGLQPPFHWREPNGPHLGMGQGFPRHVVIDARGTIGGENRRHFWEIEAEPVVEMVVSNFPGGMFVERQILRCWRVVRRQELSLVFKRRHDAFSL